MKLYTEVGRTGKGAARTRRSSVVWLSFVAAALVGPALLFVAALAPPAQAYVLLSPANAWGPPDMPVPWSLNTSLDEPTIAGTREFDIVRNSFTRWTNVAGATASVQEGPPTTVCGLVTNGLNHISFRDCLNQCTGGCLAVTSSMYLSPADAFWNPGTDTVLVARLESDMTFARGWNWDDYHDWPPCTNGFDLYGVTVHELGHFWGLGHSTLGASTMYYAVSQCDSTRASLHADDTQGFRVLYGTTDAPIAITTLTAGQASMSVTNKGNLGFTGSGGKWGSSFQYPLGSPQHLYECSFALARVGGPVSDNFRTAATDGGDADLQQASPLVAQVPGPITDEQAMGTFTDVRAESPYGVTVHSRFFADQEAANAAFVIAEYQIVNSGASTLSNIRAGLFADVDYNDQYVQNEVGYETDLSLAWVSTPNTTNRIGVVVLNVEGAAAMRALYATSTVATETFTDANKQAWMSGGFERTSLGPADIALMIATGSFTIAPGDTVRAAFAWVGGTSLEELRLHAQAAQLLYQNLITNSASGVVDGRVITPVSTLASNHPNPFGGQTQLEYTLYQEGPVELDIMDASGRRVRSMVRGHQSKGPHSLVWDGAAQSGQPLASGVYFTRLRVAGRVQTQKMLMIR
jgi:hypothetical protein